MFKRATAILITAFLLATILPGVPTAAAAESGMVRVELRSVGTPMTVSVQVNGGYQIANRSDIVLQSGDYTITNSGGSLLLTGNGVSANLGSSFTMQCYNYTSTSSGYIYVRDVMRSYLGDMIFTASLGGVRLVNRLYIEDYVIGVVRSEMNNTFPIEALKTQAIAARTYVYKSLETLDRDIYDTDADQVYRGYSSSEANVIRAVQETSGMIMTYNGVAFITYYGASNGGQVETITNRFPTKPTGPYSVMKDDPYDLRNTESLVEAITVSKNGGIGNYSLEQLLRARMGNYYGSIVGISSITQSNPRTNGFDGSRYYQTMTFTVLVGDGSYSTSSGSTGGGSLGGGSLGGSTGGSTDMTYSGSTTTQMVSINTQSDLISIISPSYKLSLFTVVDYGNYFMIEARRFGHGVGMSQRGAQQMAKEGLAFRDILNFYYVGATITQKEFTRDIINPYDPSANNGNNNNTNNNNNNTNSSAIGTGIVTASSLNVRSAASSSASKVGSLSYGATVTILGQTGDFYSIQYGTMVAYVAKAYITANLNTSGGSTGGDIWNAPSTTGTAGNGGTTGTTGSTGTITLQSSSSNLNVRSGPSTSSAIVTTVRHGTRVTVSATSGDWSAIQVVNGPYGYVMTKYITFDTGSGGAGNSTNNSTTWPSTYYTTPPAMTITTPAPGGYYQGGLGQVTYLTPTPTPTDSWSKWNAGPTPTPTNTGSIWNVPTTPPTAATPPPVVPVSSTSTGTITLASGTVMMRSEANITSNPVAEMRNGLVVTVHGVNGDWYKISVNDSAGNTYNGWVNKNYIVVSGNVANLAAATAAPTANTGGQATVVNATSLHLRSGPGTTYSSLGYLKTGDALTLGEVSGDWVAVTSGGKSGYIMKSYVSTYAGTSGATGESAQPAATTATVKLASGTLNVRSGPGSTYAPVASLKNGDSVKVTGVSGEWSAITTSGNVSGYIMTKYLSTATSSSGSSGSSGSASTTKATTTGNVHLRQSASKDSTSLGVIAKDVQVTVTSKGSEFSQVTVNGKSGYISNSYLKF